MSDTLTTMLALGGLYLAAGRVHETLAGSNNNAPIRPSIPMLLSELLVGVFSIVAFLLAVVVGLAR